MAQRKRPQPTGIPEIDTFGLRLAVLLQRRGWTKSDLARAAGVAPPLVTRLIKQERSLELKTLVKLARGLQMTLDELLDIRTQQPYETQTEPAALVVHDAGARPQKVTPRRITR